MSCYVVLCCVVLCRARLCCVVVWCGVLCCVVSYCDASLDCCQVRAVSCTYTYIWWSIVLHTAVQTSGLCQQCTVCLSFLCPSLPIPSACVCVCVCVLCQCMCRYALCQCVCALSPLLSSTLSSSADSIAEHCHRPLPSPPLSLFSISLT